MVLEAFPSPRDPLSACESYVFSIEMTYFYILITLQGSQLDAVTQEWVLDINEGIKNVCSIHSCRWKERDIKMHKNGPQNKMSFPMHSCEWIVLFHLKERWHYKSPLLHGDSLEWEKTSEIIDGNDCYFLSPLDQRIIYCRRGLEKSTPWEPEPMKIACFGFVSGSWLKALACFHFFPFTCHWGRCSGTKRYKDFWLILQCCLY